MAQSEPRHNALGTLKRLPTEIRQQVYLEYFTVDGGYVYDFASGKLRAANGQPINLSLMFTCRLIGKETSDGIALTANTITFKTACSADHEDISPGRFDFLLNEIYQAQNSMFLHILSNPQLFLAGLANEVLVRPTIDRTMCERLINAHPVFAPYWRALRDVGSRVAACTPFDLERMDMDSKQRNPWRSEDFTRASFLADLGSSHRDWGEVPSSKRQAVHDAVGLLLKRNEWPAETCTRLDQVSTSPTYAAIAHSLDGKYPPWSIPTHETCREIFELIDPHKSGTQYGGWSASAWKNATVSPTWSDEGKDEIYRYSNSRAKFYISAAASAISFLHKLPDHLRDSLRRVILEEDHVAVGRPECHGLGLIPFCQANPRLRIERRAQLWENVFQCEPSRYANPESRRRGHGIGMEAFKVTRRIAMWATEARALGAAGMPPGSFSLIFDGGRWPWKATQVFRERVQRDLAWQLAFDLSLERGLLPRMSYLDKRRCVMYISEDFPSAMRDIMNGTSTVRCNFQVGRPWDVETIVLQNQDLSVPAWMQRWHCFGKGFNLGLGEPDWIDILDEGFLPWPYGQYPYHTVYPTEEAWTEDGMHRLTSPSAVIDFWSFLYPGSHQYTHS